MGRFTLDLENFRGKVSSKANAVVRKVVFDISTNIVYRSPVGDPKFWVRPAPPGYVGGRFRGNWQYGEGAMPTGELPDIDPSGAATIARIAGGLGLKAAGKIHYLANNLPYANKLEDGSGSPRQAPRGMVGLAVTEFVPIVEAAARAL